MPKKIVPAMDAAESSSDDEAPEEINVSSSRQQGLSQMKEIYQSEKKSRNEEREKRRKRNEIFRLQKEKKLQDLSKRKLPQDVLDAVSANSSKNISQGNEGPVISKKSKKHVDDDDREEDEEDEDVAEEDSGDDRLSDSGVEDDGGDDAANDFIPLGNSGNLALVTNEVLAKQKLTAAQKALNFKHSQLYNQPTIPRENTKQRRARMAKRKANQLR